MQQRLMSRTILSIGALTLAVVLAVCAPGAWAQAAAGQTLRQQMGAAEFKAAGLDKLTADELAALQAWIRRGQEGAATAAAGGNVATATAGATVLSASEIEDIREQAREEGREEVKQENRGFFNFGSSEPIASNLVGDFRGFAKGRQYTLANGQVWQQTDDATLHGVRAQSPAVTIRPGLSNAWYLRIDGSNTGAKVQRVK